MLLEQFCQVGFSTFIEALSLANTCSKQPMFSWSVFSETGGSVLNSVRLLTPVNGGLDALDRRDTIIICGGSDPKEAMSAKVIAWLRREHRKGVVCGALGTGVFTLAKAGLLNGKRAVVHWEYQDAFREFFPEIEIEDAIFSVLESVFTSVGRAGTPDLTMHLISVHGSYDVAAQVAERMVFSALRQPNCSQHLSLQVRFGSRNPNLLKAFKIISENLETPVSPSDIASMIGFSRRHLERLFKSKIGISPKSYYVKMRLQKARSLLLHTDLAISEIAFACGFISLTHFSKSYLREFGVSPSKDTGMNATPLIGAHCENAGCQSSTSNARGTSNYGFG
ncbi:MAG: GlxA family transcriptional regulator [Hyphomicrobiales bacterium]|nr:GlxA family transcriptional regulator [Hyphomicrobiales bacterium]